MENNYSYYNWFKKVISIFIEIFFIAAPLASLYVFTSFLSGGIRLAAFAAIIIVYLLVIYFGRKHIKSLINSFLNKVSGLETWKMVLIIIFTALILKIISTLFFGFDATKGGDVEIYNEIADQIIATGDIHSDAISHLYGVALHLVVFKLIGIPLHVAVFLVLLLGSIINFYSFERIIGKDKSFIAVMIYVIMPSTILLSFCPTHEVFVYLYISIFLFSYNRMLKEENTAKTFLFLIIMIISTILTCFVNPGGYILYIIMVLTVLLSNVLIKKKILIVVCLILSMIGSSAISRYLNVNEYTTTINTYTILIHGTNPESLGEQIDGYPLKQMRMYIYDHTLDFSDEGFLDAAKHVLINQCVYLFKHPVTFLKLIVHKIYILWSGVHYPIEMANIYGSLSGFAYLIALGLNTLIYLFTITLGTVYYNKNVRSDDIEISNYKLELLGVIALTLICIVVNKYSLYVTLFIYLISFYRSSFGEIDG